MSGYLMRLAMRARTGGDVRSLQPFVRSTSPVFERDQRIGIMGFDEFASGESSPVLESPPIGDDRSATLGPPAPSELPAASEPGETTVQGKVANPKAGPIPTSTPASTADGELTHTSLPPATPAVNHIQRFATSEPILPPFVTASPSSGEMSIRPTGGPHQEPLLAKAESGALPPHTRVEDPERGLSGDGQAESAAFRQPDSIATSDEVANRTDPQEHVERAPSKKVEVRAHPTRQAGRIDTPRLEPSPQSFDKHPEPPLGDTGVPTDEFAEGPRVVIGRINVEVVPPPAAPSSSTAPRPKPLSAAAASIIGPLGGSIHPSLRLSLRHR